MYYEQVTVYKHFYLANIEYKIMHVYFVYLLQIKNLI